MKDIASDLRERFDYAAYFYLSAWEFDPDMRIVDNAILRDQAKEESDDRMAEIFEGLRDSVNSVPKEILAETGELRGLVGQGEYEEIVGLAVQNVGHTSFPKSAAEFLQTLNLSLQFAASKSAIAM